LALRRNNGEEDSQFLFKEGDIEKTQGFNDFTSIADNTQFSMNASSFSKFSKLTGVGKKFQENFK
jgi:hypothetical protein